MTRELTEADFLAGVKASAERELAKSGPYVPCPWCGLRYGRPGIACCGDAARFVASMRAGLKEANEDHARNCPADIVSVIQDADYLHADGAWPGWTMRTHLPKVTKVHDDAQGVTIEWVPLGVRNPWDPGWSADKVRVAKVWVIGPDWIAYTTTEGGEPYPRGKILMLHIGREGILRDVTQPPPQEEPAAPKPPKQAKRTRGKRA